MGHDPKPCSGSGTSAGVGLIQSNDSHGESHSLFFLNLKWLSATEAVAYLRLPSIGSLRNLVYRRRIPFTKCGRKLRFDREELDRFLESSKISRRISL